MGVIDKRQQGLDEACEGPVFRASRADEREEKWTPSHPPNSGVKKSHILLEGAEIKGSPDVLVSRVSDMASEWIRMKPSEYALLRPHMAKIQESVRRQARDLKAATTRF